MSVERWISMAEIAYKSGNIKSALRHATAGLNRCATPETCTALRIFIARCHSKLGNFDKSNKIYRALLNEKNYLPPIIMGLLYNNFQSKKAINNVRLIKIFVR